MVSVIIPTYNRAQSIAKSIDSVLMQTYRDLEVIVVDDGSADDTEKVIRQIHDPRLIYIRQENAGACAARNNGMKHARGEFIAFQDSDDIWYGDKLEKQMAVAKKSGADVVFCKMQQIDQEGNVSIIPSKNFTEGIVKDFSYISGIGTQALLISRKAADRIAFDEKMVRFQDLEWFLRACKVFSVYCIDEPLVDYFIEQDSISADSAKLFNAANYLLKKHPDLPILHPLSAKEIYEALFRCFWLHKFDAGKDAFGEKYRSYLYLACKYGGTGFAVAQMIKRPSKRI